MVSKQLPRWMVFCLFILMTPVVATENAEAEIDEGFERKCLSRAQDTIIL